MAINLGWLADLISQRLYIDAVAQASRRAWNLSAYFSASDDATNERTDIDLDLAEVAAQATAPAVLSGVEAVGTSGVLARADHAHALGVDTLPTSSVTRQACTVAFDGSGVTSGASYGFILDEEVATTGTSILAELRRSGSPRWTFSGEGSGQVTFTTASCTASDGASEIDLIPSGTGAVTRTYEVRQDTAIASSSTATYEIAIPDGYMGRLQFVATSATTSGTALAETRYDALVKNVSGTAAIEAGTFATRGTAADGTAAAASGGVIEITLTNNHGAAKTYAAYWTLDTQEFNP